MWGNGIGSLNIYKVVKDSFLPELVWTKSGDQDNIWRMGTIKLPKTTSNVVNNFTIVFEGVKGKNIRGLYIIKLLFFKKCNLLIIFKGNIALDDISIREGR